MKSELRMRWPGGVTLTTFLKRVDTAIQPTAGDISGALLLQHRRIINRTARGLDADGRSFTAYDDKHPYYWNPKGSTAGVALTSSQRQSRNRLARTVRGKGGAKKTSRGIRFDSYAAFKASFGRVLVDLTSVGRPTTHMMMSIVLLIRGTSRRLRGAESVGSVSANTRPATEGRLVIRGAPGPRAASHNEGLGRMPRRQFLAWGIGDLERAKNFVVQRMENRLRHVLKGGT